MQSFDHSDTFLTSGYLSEKERLNRKKKYEDYKARLKKRANQIHLHKFDIQLKSGTAGSNGNQVTLGKVISCELKFPLTYVFTKEKLTRGRVYSIALENRTLNKQIFVKGVCVWTRQIQTNFGILNKNAYKVRNELHLIFDNEKQKAQFVQMIEQFKSETSRHF